MSFLSHIARTTFFWISDPSKNDRAHHPLASSLKRMFYQGSSIKCLPFAFAHSKPLQRLPPATTAIALISKTTSSVIASADICSASNVSTTSRCASSAGSISTNPPHRSSLSGTARDVTGRKRGSSARRSVRIADYNNRCMRSDSRRNRTSSRRPRETVQCIA